MMPARQRPDRLGVIARGVVQGFGLRPFVQRTATSLGLSGFVRNVPGGIAIEAEGSPGALEALVRAVSALPAPARVDAIERTALEPIGETSFYIEESLEGATGAFPLLPDLATCDDCMAEVLDPDDRRHRYPFVSCTRCGPRWSVAHELPWDRARTSMAGFALCPDCRAEYEDPQDVRRFHAQTLACPRCGPQLVLLTPDGRAQCSGDAALGRSAEVLKAGGIVAMLGLGGFQLLVDARDANGVRRLRKRKNRPDKPLALVVADVEGAREIVHLTASECAAFLAPAAPVVLARRRGDADVAPSVAPGVSWLGVMRATTPLHRLLLDAVEAPLVATSGNLSGEPLCANDEEALEHLGQVADVFLTHDRPVVRPVDDSVVREIGGRIVSLRCGRGLAPLSLPRRGTGEARVALGGDLKNAVAVAVGGEVVLGPHIGDLASPRANDAAVQTASSLATMMDLPVTDVVSDAHPDSHVRTIARDWAKRHQVRDGVVFHHHAHVLAGWTEHGGSLPVLGVAWDGAGFGPDRGAWGGEILRVDERRVERVAHLRPFRLPGGDAAAREPRRAALGLLFARFGEAAFERDDAALRSFDAAELRVLERLLASGRFAPETSSAGRLFDAIASLLGVRQRCSYEGQAALELESLASEDDGDFAHPLVRGDGVLDWAPLVDAVLSDRDAGTPIRAIAARFHRGLARALVDVVAAAAAENGIGRVVLSGGCFQNALLSSLTEAGLREAGLEPLPHTRIPPNDGGLAVGQLQALACTPGEAGV